MKNKGVIIGIIVVLVLAAGGYGVWKTFISHKPEVVVEDEEIISLPPVDDSVKVLVASAENNTKVILTIENIPTGTASIEYELTYETAKGLPKGAIGKIRIEDGESSTEKEVLLGTCSKGVCRYDEGVEEVDLVMKFNHPDGASQFQESYEL